MAEENVESNAFLQTNETLSTGIREALLNIADAALSRKIIHENTHSEVLNLRHPIEVRTLSFLRAIRDRIRIDPQAFHVFVSILERQHSMEYLGTKLKESLENQKEDLKRRQAVSAASTHTNPSLTQGEMTIIKGGQPVIRQAIARPTQLVAPAREQQHSYAGMQHAKLPGKPVTFSNLNRYHSPGAPVHHRTSLATVTHPATTTVTVGNHEPLSEPVMKYHTTTSPGMMFRNNTVFGASMQEDNVSSTSDVNAVTRRAITPGPEASDSRTIFSSGLTGKNVPRIFRKNYRWVCA